MSEERAKYQVDAKTLAILDEPFPDEAKSTDDSRGFELEGLRGYYVIERLNRAFGLCGTGWQYNIALSNPGYIYHIYRQMDDCCVQIT